MLGASARQRSTVCARCARSIGACRTSSVPRRQSRCYEDGRGNKYADAEGRYRILAGFHTHPTNDSPHGDASEHDKRESVRTGIPEYIVDETGVHRFDPDGTDNPRNEEDAKATRRRNGAARKAQASKREELKRE